MNKVKIQNYDDRMKMVAILASAGYEVWIEEGEGRSLLHPEYYVCWRERERVKAEE